MAFSGYLIKVGGSNGTILPMKFMKAESYKSTPAQRMESKATRDATGVLHRTTVEHTATKIEFETPYLTNDQVASLNSMLRSAMSNNHRKDITIYYYDMETNSYRSASCYIPDIKYTIYRVDGNTIIYKPIRYAFIEY